MFRDALIYLAVSTLRLTISCPRSVTGRECNSESCSVGSACGNREIQKIHEEDLPFNLAAVSVRVLANEHQCACL